MSVEQLALVPVVGTATELDVLYRGFAPHAVRVDMMELAKGPLVAASPALAHERARTAGAGRAGWPARAKGRTAMGATAGTLERAGGVASEAAGRARTAGSLRTDGGTSGLGKYWTSNSTCRLLLPFAAASSSWWFSALRWDERPPQPSRHQKGGMGCRSSWLLNTMLAFASRTVSRTTITSTTIIYECMNDAQCSSGRRDERQNFHRWPGRTGSRLFSFQFDGASGKRAISQNLRRAVAQRGMDVLAKRGIGE